MCARTWCAVLAAVICTVLVTIGASAATAADHYIRAGAGGVNDGRDWTNAWSTWPSAFVRGDRYYIADGEYPKVIFGTKVSADVYIEIVKATTLAHGTDVGWSDEYGDGSAHVNNPTVGTDYWIFDGVTRSPDWDSGYGIQFINKNANDKVCRFSVGVGNVVMKYIDFNNLRGCKVVGEVNDNLYAVLNGGNISISHCRFFDSSRNSMIIDKTNANKITVEYSLFKYSEGSPAQHSQAIRAWGAEGQPHGPGACSNVVIRYNRFEDIEGSGFITLAWGNDHVRIYGNVFYYSTSNPMAREGTSTSISDLSDEIDERGVSDLAIYNNSFVNLDVDSSRQDETGFLNMGFYIVRKASESVYAYNNLWYGGDGSSLAMLNVSKSDYNYFSSVYLRASRLLPSEANSEITSTAVLQDLVGKDFHLAVPTKSGLDLTNEAWWSTEDSNVDPDGKVRGGDGVWDRGAFEYSGLQSPKKVIVVE